MNPQAEKPPGAEPGRTRGRLERDYESRIRSFETVARRVGAGDPASIAELCVRAEALLGFLQVWRGLFDPDVWAVLAGAVRRLARRARRARRFRVRAELMSTLIADVPGSSDDALAPAATHTSGRLDRTRRRLQSVLEPSRLEPVIDLLTAAAATLPTSLPARLQALEHVHLSGRRERERAMRAVRRALEQISPGRLGEALRAVRRWHAVAACRFEAKLGPAEDREAAAQWAETVLALEHRVRLRRSLSRRLRPRDPAADSMALVLLEIDAECARWTERLRALESGTPDVGVERKVPPLELSPPKPGPENPGSV